MCVDEFSLIILIALAPCPAITVQNKKPTIQDELQC